MKRICFVLQVKPDRLKEYKSATITSGRTCRALCAKSTGPIIPCSCAPMACWSAISRPKTSSVPAPADFFVQPTGVLPDRAIEPLEEVFYL